MNIPEGTVLAHAKRHSWTQQIQVATQQQSDAITPVQSVPQSLAAILSERKDRTKLGLSKYAAEAAEQAAEHRDKLGIAGKVRDVSAIHSSLWPEEPKTNEILPGWRILIGAENVIDAKTGYVCDGPDKGKFFPVEANEKVTTDAQTAKVVQPAIDCSATDVIADATPAPIPRLQDREQVIDAQLAPASGIVNSLPPSPGLWRTGWEEPRESAVIFKCRRSRRGR
jgi:hypothetical protein